MSASALVDDLALSLCGNTAREPCEALALGWEVAWDTKTPKRWCIPKPSVCSPNRRQSGIRTLGKAL